MEYMGKRVAVIVLNYITWKMTLDFVEKLREVICPEDTIIVVDNNSPNDSATRLSTWNEKSNRPFIFLLSHTNDGYAAGNNIGIRWAAEHNYKYSWVCNNDLIFNDMNILLKMVTVMDENIELAAVSPRVFDYKEKREINRNLKRPSIVSLTLGAISCARKSKIINRKVASGWCFSYRPQGCCMLLRNSAMRKINFMDERTFLYCEESILAERMALHNYRCACILDATVIHNHSSTVNSVMKREKTFYIHRQSRAVYYEYLEYSRTAQLWCDLFLWIRHLCGK